MLVPQPPLDMVVNKEAEFWITASLGVIALAALLYSLWHWKRSGRPVFLLLYIAGGAMMIFEPLVDTVGACWFPANSYVAFHAYGRPIPVWLCCAYFFYFGIGVGAIWAQMRRGITRQQLWVVFIIGMLADLVFEKVLLVFDPYVYYGYQPLLFGKFPLWWMAVNALIPIVAAAVIYRFEDMLSGWRHLWIVPIVLTASATTNAGVGWPAWFVINTNVGPVLTQFGGIATFALAFAAIAIIGRFVARDAADRVTAAAFTRPVAN
jgi:hypothetical protein